MNKITWMIIAVSVLTACTTSTVAPINYYLLDAPVSDRLISTAGDTPQVLLAPIRLAEYLRQPGMAMRIDAHQVYYSRDHVWAEPLLTGISRVMLNDLNAHAEHSHFVTQQAPNHQMAEKTLQVSVEHFIVTNDSRALFRGRYWISSDNGKKSVERTFNLEETLGVDGYPHSVSILRQLIHSLSRQIIMDIEQQGT